jgi:acetyl-CoA acetyltransferase
MRVDATSVARAATVDACARPRRDSLIVSRPRRRPPFLGATAIAGVGYTELTKASGRSVLDLATEACARAIADAGLSPAEVDGVASFRFLEDSVPAQAVATALGAPGSNWLLDLNLGGQAPCFLVTQAAMAVHLGLARHVVLYRALNGRSGARVGTNRAPGPATDFRYPVGLTAYVHYISLWARRFLIETGQTEDDLATIAVAQRAWAERNERAYLRAPHTVEAHRAAPYVAEPFRVPDCTIEVDGACALVVTTLDAARDLARPPVVLQGAAYVAGRGLDMGDSLFWDDLSRNYTSLLADDLWGSAGIAAPDVDVAEIYDCFTSTVLMGLEGLGLAERGGSADFVRQGRLPVNTNGGLLAEGYLHGMNTVAEAVLQLQGRSGVRTVGAETCVVTSGALTDGSALVLAVDR